jgi:cytochrome c5
MKTWIVLAALTLPLLGCPQDTKTPAAAASKKPAEAAPALFARTCGACHGKDAKGLPGLGKDMTASEFIKKSSDAEILKLVNTGIPASKLVKVPMPPKGGFADLTDDDILRVIKYIRTLK